MYELDESVEVRRFSMSQTESGISFPAPSWQRDQWKMFAMTGEISLRVQSVFQPLPNCVCELYFTSLRPSAEKCVFYEVKYGLVI
jgi:hypothetical protein